MLLIYVDDIIVIGNSNSSITTLISHLSTVFYMKDLGNLYYFFSVKITCDNDIITLNQSWYLLSLLQSFDVTKSVAIPHAYETHLSAYEGTLLDDPYHYRQMVDTPQYLTLTRLDVAFVEIFLGKSRVKPKDKI